MKKLVSSAIAIVAAFALVVGVLTSSFQLQLTGGKAEASLDATNGVTLRFLPDNMSDSAPVFEAVAPQSHQSGSLIAADTKKRGIKGIVFVDSNKNGALNSREKGLAGVKVTMDGAGLNASAVTDAGGNYQFVDMAEGTYTLTAAPPAGYQPTTSLALSVTVIDVARTEVQTGRIQKLPQMVAGENFGFAPADAAPAAPAVPAQSPQPPPSKLPKTGTGGMSGVN